MNQAKIGAFIKQLRHENNLTQEALGEKLGVTNKTISRWENANYMPDIEMLQLLSHEFHISINELLCGERISESDYRKKADENLVELMKTESFTKKEQYSFWGKKWLKDHTSWLIFLFTLSITVGVGTWYVGSPILNALIGVLVFITVIKLRSDMAGYIEGNIYKPKK